jgi:hypothetical protein
MGMVVGGGGGWGGGGGGGDVREGVMTLSDELNWKPYWGINPNASIIHFQGAKVHAVVL